MVLCCRKRPPHPRDGPWAWLVCIVTLIMNILLFGVLLSFGVLLPILSKEFGESKGKTAWVGSLATGLAFSMGLPVVKLTSYFTLRTLSIFGGIACMTSLIISSFVSNMTILFFSYGILFGLGGGFIVTCLSLANNMYFKTKMPQAMGIATSGSSLGVIAIGPTMQALVDHFGWRVTLRIMSGAMLLMSLLSITYDPNVEKDSHQERREITLDEEEHAPESRTRRRESSTLNCSVWSNCTYSIGALTVFVVFFGLYTPVFHVVRFSQDFDIPSNKASQLFIYIGAGSTIARILSGQVINRHLLTPLQCIQMAALTMGTAMIVFTQATLYSHFVVFSVFYGLANGTFVSSQAVFFLTAVEPSQAAMGLSYGFMSASVAIVAGPAAAGFIADMMGSYIPAFYIIGSIVALVSLLPFTITCCTSRKSNEDIRDVTLESRMELIGLRLANDAVDSTLYLNFL